MEEQNYIKENSSDYVQEILGKTPPLFLRMGIYFFFFFILLLLFLAHLIRFPDQLEMQGDLILGQKPLTIVPKTSGTIDSIFIDDKGFVQANDTILTIKSTLTESGINEFNNFFLKFKEIKHNSKYLGLKVNENLNLGELTPIFASIAKNHLEFQNFLNDPYVSIKINSIKEEIEQIKKLNLSLQRQEEYYNNDVSLTEKDFKRNLLLEKEGVIASTDREKSESKLLGEKRSLEAFKASVINNNIRVQQLTTQIAELEANRTNGIKTRIFSITQQMQELKSRIKEWENIHKIIAPISGQVSFNYDFIENDPIKESETLLKIIPTSSKSKFYLIEGLLAIRSSGTLKTGQKALVNFINYPSSQYGVVTGVVKDISLIPSQDYYRVRIELPNDLRTSYNKEITISPLLKANVSINTQEYSLLERIFQNILDLLKNR